MHTLTGRLLFAHRYPRGRRANSGVFSVPGSAGAGTGAQNRAECPGPGPQCLKDRSFFTGCGPQCLPFAQNPVCRHPRLLNTPKNARRILPQAPAARRRIATASLVTAGGPRAYLSNLSAGWKDPPREAHGGVLTCPRTIWEVSPGVSDESSFGRGYSSPKLMPNALASRTRSLWGSTYLSLPATSSSGMWHILPSRRAIM